MGTKNKKIKAKGVELGMVTDQRIKNATTILVIEIKFAQKVFLKKMLLGLLLLDSSSMHSAMIFCFVYSEKDG